MKVDFRLTAAHSGAEAGFARRVLGSSMAATTTSEASIPAIPAPMSRDDPCGPDLDAILDADYMNCVARLQGDLPRSFLSYLYPASEEDRAAIDFQRTFAEIATFTGRTHDLRLLVLQARFEILALDLPRFHQTIARIAGLLTGYWDAVHPRAEEGGVDRRRTEIAALDDPMVIFALQYAPLCENRRTGRVSWRALLYAQGKAKPRAGEATPNEGALIEALTQADEDEIGPSRAAIAGLIVAVTQIRTTWQAQADEPPPLDKLLELLQSIQGLLNRGRPDAPPTLMERATAAIGGLLGAKSEPAASSGGGVASDHEAGAALAALAHYFTAAEPSSPALPLIDQAANLRGKSFYEALQALLPKHADQAVFKIGSQSIFELALSRAAGTKGDGTRLAANGNGTTPDPSTKTFRVETRQQAVAVIGEVIAFYRSTEPSSPIPWLLDRARGLAERDFMSLLGDVLPKAALRDINQA